MKEQYKSIEIHKDNQRLRELKANSQRGSDMVLIQG